MRLKIKIKKTISIIATVALIINSIAPYSVIFAQEVTPEPTPEATTASSITPIELPTATPVDLTSATNIPATPTESPTTSPDMTPPDTNTPSPEFVPTATDLVTSTPSDQPTTVQDPESNPTTQGPPSSDQPTSTPTLTPTFTSTVEPENSSVTTTVVQTSIIPQIVKDNSWFKLVTDKLDYAPDEMAIITGSNFEPNKTYSLTVSSTDEPAVSTTSEIKSDGSGSFTFYYQLDGKYRPNYSVVVKDGEAGVASTTFTDTDWPSCGFQCTAGDTEVTSLTLVDSSNHPITSCTAGQTVNATIRGVFSNTSGSDRVAAVMLGDIYQGSTLIKHFQTGSIDGQCVADTLEKQSNTTANLHSFFWVCGQTVTINNLVLSWDTGHSTCDGFFHAPSCSNRTTKCYSGTSFSVSGPGTLVVHKTFTDGHSNTGIGINVTGPVPMSGTTNANGDAIFVPGTNGTYTAHAVEPSGYYESANTCVGVTVAQGQTTNCTITDSPTTGSLTVIKHVNNDNGGTKEAKDFAITVTGGTPSNFFGSEAGTIVTVAANGIYNVTEGAVNGYLPNYSTDCSGTMPPAGNKTCTITNDDIQPKLTITKTVNGGTAQVSDFNLFAGTTQFTSGIQKGINVGTYAITETGAQTSNYTTTFGGDCSSGSVTLGIGDVKNCTITNNVKLGSVNVVKYQDSNANGVYNDEPGLLGWTISLSGQTNKTNISDSNGLTPFTGILPGNYILSETLHSGWTQSNISCDNGTYSPTNQNFNLTVAPGSTVNCKIGNYQSARLTVAKQVISPTGGAVTNDSTNFAFSAAGHSFNLTNGSNQGFDLTPGIYSVTESENPNYTFNGCTNLTAGQITLTSGQTPTVTCTNQQKVATITVNKVIKNSNGDVVVDGHTFVAQLNGDTNQNFSVGNSTSYDVNPGGTYAISEAVDANYTNLGCKLASGADATGITLASNEKITVTCVNQQKPGSISGYKFMADGLTPISGWTVNLLSCITAYDSCSQKASTTTNGTGFYSFTNLIKGFYQVIEYLDPNYTQVGSTSHNVTINAETNSLESTANNFDNFKNINITVCKKSDTDGSLTTTTDQTNVPGWEIILYSNGQEIADQRTGNDGCTTFSNLGPNNNYSASEVAQTGWRNIGDTTFNFSAPADGQNQNHTFYNQRLSQIIIQKITDPGVDSQSFAFTLSGGASGLDQSFNLAGGENYDSGYVIPGSGYLASETVPSGWNQTGAICDNQSSVNNISVTAGNTVTCTFTNTKEGALIVHNFEDMNYDGILDTGEVPPQVTSWPSTLFNGSGCTGSVIANGSSTYTDGNALYNGLAPGNYSVRETAINAAWKMTTPTCQNVTITAGQSSTLYFGKIALGSLVGYKYLDSNADGQFNGTDTKLSGWQIFVDANKDGVYQDGELTDTTDNNGDYHFYSAFEPGDYQVCEVLQNGWFQSQPNGCHTFSITSSNESLSGYNFGNYQKSHLSVVKIVTDPQANTITSGDTTAFGFNVTGQNEFHLQNTESEEFDLIPGSYQVSENTNDDYTFMGCTNLNTDNIITLVSNQTATVTCTNQQKQGTITGLKWNDLNENGHMDEEPTLPEWTIFADLNQNGTFDNGEPSTLTDANGDYYLNLNPGTYSICEVIPAGWQQTYPAGETGCHNFVQVLSGQTSEVWFNFGNYLIPIPSLKIAKSNISPNISAGDTAIYTLTITNDGNVGVEGITAKDVLPGGFTYVTNSTTGSTTSDPSIVGNVLSWTGIFIAKGESWQITYSAKSASDLSNGDYTNFASCKTIARDETVNCDPNPVSSTVSIGKGQNYGGNLNLEGQVLGASTELPGTGSPTEILFATVALLGLGIAIKYYNKKKYVDK